MRGSRVCSAHGGNAPQVRAAAARRLAAEKVAADVEAVLAYEARVPLRDPVEALALLASEAILLKDALAQRVNSLTSLRYTSANGLEQVRAEMLLFERALDRAARFADLLAKSGFAERRARLDEQQAALVVSALRAIFARLQLTPEQQALTATVVPAELRRISAMARAEVVG